MLNCIIGIYRVVIASVYFAFFGLGSLIISVIFFNLMRLVVTNGEKRTRISRNITRYAFKLYLSTACLLRIFDIKISKTELTKNDRGCIYIANHPSLLDVVILDSFVNNSNCVIKASLKNNPFISGIIACNRYVKNSLSPEDILRDCKDSLNRGDNLIIFPEGTRTVNFDKIKFKHGFSSIAVACRADIRPVIIRFDGFALRKNVHWYQIYKKKLTYRIEVLDKFETEKYLNMHQGKEDSAVSRSIAKELQTVIQDRLNSSDSKLG